MNVFQLFKALESFDRKPPSKSIVQKVADAYEMLGLSEEKNRVLEKYGSLLSETPAAGRPRRQPRRAVKKPVRLFDLFSLHPRAWLTPAPSGR